MLWILNIIVQSFVCYLLIRSLWFYKKRRKFTYQAGRLVKDNIRKMKYLKQVDLDRALLYYFIELFWGFNKMYFHFWIWDFKKMVHNKEAFEEIEKFIEKSENNVLLFKKRDIKNEDNQNENGTTEVHV